MTNNQVVIVTGATGSIGKAIAQQIATKQDFEVVLACRDEVKAKQARQEIIQATGNEKVRCTIVDVSRRASIEAMADQWSGPLSILINNAAVTPRTRQETPEGIELQFATNVLGYYWMSEAFAKFLKQDISARIVNIASYWAGELDLSDLEFKRRPYENRVVYSQSKQANRMLTVAFAERLKPFGISVNACHPGDVDSKLSDDMDFTGSETPDQGAETPVWLATTPIGLQETGKYFEHLEEKACSLVRIKRVLRPFMRRVRAIPDLSIYIVAN